MVQRIETVNSRAVAAIESSTNTRFAAFEQMLRQSETVVAQTMVATEASVENKKSAFGQLVQRAELLENKFQSILSAEASVDKKTAVLKQLLRKAALFENKLQAVESLEFSVDKKMGALEMLARKVETLKAIEGTSKQHHEIFALHQKGLKNKDIGEVLDMPLGEVELILALLPQTREAILTREGNIFCEAKKMLNDKSGAEAGRPGRIT